MDAYSKIDFTPELLANLMDFAAGQPPPGVTPDFEHQASNALVLWITCGICIPIMLIAAAGKFWVKFTSGKRKLTWGDVVFIIALLGSLSWIILSLVATTTNFFGRHMWDIKLRFLTKRIILISTLGECFWPLWFLLIKISIFAMYLELFGVKRWLRWGCYIGMAMMTAFHLAAVLFYAISCSPVGGNDGMAYLMGYLSKRCLAIFPIIIMQAVVNIVGDLYLIILPLPAVWSLNMPTRKKWAISAIFFAGFTGIAASACSLYYRIDLHSATDLTWISIVPWATSVYEMMVGIVVACMPALTALVRRWLAPSRPSDKSSQNDYYLSSGSREIRKSKRSIPSIFRLPKRYQAFKFSRIQQSEQLPSRASSIEEKPFPRSYSDNLYSKMPIQTQTETQTSADTYSNPSYSSPPRAHYNFSHPRRTSTSPRQAQSNSYGLGLTHHWEPLELSHLQFPTGSPVTSIVLMPRSNLKSRTESYSPLSQRSNSPTDDNTNIDSITSPARGGRKSIPIHTSHIANAAIRPKPKPDIQPQILEYDENNRF